MKKTILSLLLMLPLMAQAQNGWERFDGNSAQKQETKQEKAEKAKKAIDPKYLAGAVEEVDGRVQWTFEKAVPGKSAQEIYDRMLDYLQDFTKQDNQLEGSHVALVNKAEHSIAVSVKEWLVFKQNFIGIDRAKTTYTLMAYCTDGKVTVTVSRIIFDYTENVPAPHGIYKAEDWISDRAALNKKKTKVLPGCVKFRTKMIDRKDEIFAQVEQLF